MSLITEKNDFSRVVNLVDILRAAEACHKVNNVIRELAGEEVIPWEETTEEIRQSAISGVQQVVKNPDITAADIHGEWMSYKKKQGWIYGEERDENKKTHPGMRPFSELDKFDKLKDSAFVVTAKGMLF